MSTHTHEVIQAGQTLVVVANASQARFFAREKKFSPLLELEEKRHPESRMHGRELDRDAPGQVFQSANPSEDSMGEASDSKRREAAKFAHEIASELKKARGRGNLGRLVLVAEPAFLGLLRANLDEPTRSKVALEIAKNHASDSPKAIQEAIDAAY